MGPNIYALVGIIYQCRRTLQEYAGMAQSQDDAFVCTVVLPRPRYPFRIGYTRSLPLRFDSSSPS